MAALQNDHDKPVDIADAYWWRSVTLAERLQSLRRRETKTNPEINKALAQKRLKRWRSKAPFNRDGIFERWLETAAYTQEELLQILGEPLDVVRSSCQLPPSFIQFIQALDEPEPQSALPFSAEALAQYPGADFLAAIAPLIHQTAERLRTGIAALSRSYSPLPFDPATIESLFFAKVPDVSFMLDRMMVVELHMGRDKGLLAGETSAERYQSFIRLLHEPLIRKTIWRKYPVLARLLVSYLQNWVESRLEFLERLCQDWEAICRLFSPQQNPGMLVDLQTDLGDKHRHGRAVISAHFQSGLQIIYKPKPLAVDRHYQELLSWLNERGASPPLLALRILDKGHYGWVEAVNHHSCRTEAEIRRFYQRHGANLALLYILEGCDFHADNIIAFGEYPVLIDLEGLFHPRWRKDFNSPPSWEAGIRDILDSVMRTGLLPQRAFASESSPGVDWSGIRGGEDQLTARPSPYWEGVGTDQMHVGYKRQIMKGIIKNLPLLNEEPVAALPYVNDIVTGFNQLYTLLLAHRDSLLAAGGPILAFAQDDVRVFLRATSMYKLFMHDSCHPLLVEQDALERDRFLIRLAIGIQNQMEILRAIPGEGEDIMGGDIPVFTTHPHSRDLWTSSGERLPDFFKEPSLSWVKERLANLSKADQARQAWYIKASFAAYHLDDRQWAGTAHTRQERQTAVSTPELLTAAQTVAQTIEAAALVSEQHITWITPTLLVGRHGMIVPSDISLYTGSSGIALFLAYLGEIAQSDHFTRLAQTTAASLRADLPSAKATMTTIGGYEGWGGVIYALTHLGILWQDTALLDEAGAAIDHILPLIDADEQFNVISGAAGCLLALLALHRARPNEAALAAARQCGDHLVARAYAKENGLVWQSKGRSQPRSGLAYGSAGIIWALLELSAATSDGRFETAARQALAYERNQSAAAAANGSGLHGANGRQNGLAHTTAAWCHGSAGLGLARLRCLPYLQEDAKITAEINAALQTTLAQGFGKNHSLCHGDLGNLELLLQAGQHPAFSQWAERVRPLAGMVLESASDGGWLCGTPLLTETPGLMTGLAGIGYGLLRLARPERVPAVLLLEPPVMESSPTMPDAAAMPA